MKVLLIGKTLSLGGTSRYTNNLIRAFNEYPELDFEFINLKEYYDLPGKYMKRLNLIRKFPKEIDFDKYDLVHFLQLDYSLYGTLRFLKKRTRRPIILKTSHGTSRLEEYYQGFIQRHIMKPFNCYIQRYVQRNVDAVIYVSDEQRDFVIKEYNLDRSKTYVVYLSSNFETYQGNIKNLINNKEKVILFVGRVEKRKRIELFCELAKLMPHWRFKVVGHVDDQDYYGQIQKLKPENMDFLVNISDDELVDAYRRAKYFVSFSKWENCPVSYLESISQGTPVIAYSMPIHKMIENDCGYRIQSPNEAANKIRELEQKYDSIVENAINTSQMFSWEKTARETMKIYKKLLNSYRQV